MKENLPDIWYILLFNCHNVVRVSLSVVLSEKTAASAGELPQASICANFITDFVETNINLT